jgi:hypothetical protein
LEKTVMQSRVFDVSWKIMLIPVAGLLILGAIGLFVPGVYAGMYWETDSGQTWNEFMAESPRIGRLILVLFQANALGMIMFGILAMFVLVKAVRKGEWWAWLALLAGGSVGWGGDMFLELLVGKTVLAAIMAGIMVSGWMCFGLAYRAIFSGGLQPDGAA